MVTVSSTPETGVGSVAAAAARALSDLYDDGRADPESPWGIRFRADTGSFFVHLPDVYLSLRGMRKDLVMSARTPLEALIETIQQLKEISRYGGVVMVKRRHGARKLQWAEYSTTTGVRLERPTWRVVPK